MLVRTCCFLLLLLTGSHTLSAGPGGKAAIQDKDLLRVFAAIRSADGYAYSLTVSSRLLTGAQAGPADSALRSSGLQYASRQEAIAYSSKGAEQFLLCPKGLFKIDAEAKAIYHHLFSSEAERAGYLSAYPADGGAAALDSLLLRPATVVSKKKRGQLLTIQLSYPKDWLIREATVIYDERTGFLNSMSYTMDRPAGPGTQPGEARTVVRQQVAMRDYSKGPPAAARELLAGFGTEGLAFLQKRYPGFRLQPM